MHSPVGFYCGWEEGGWCAQVFTLLLFIYVYKRGWGVWWGRSSGKEFGRGRMTVGECVTTVLYRVLWCAHKLRVESLFILAGSVPQLTGSTKSSCSVLRRWGCLEICMSV